MSFLGFSFGKGTGDLTAEGKKEARKNFEKDERKLASLEYKKLKAELDSYEQDTSLRKGYANKVFWLLVSWMIFIAIIFSLYGLNFLIFPSEVIITLLTTTTVTVVGIFMVVARNIFPNKPGIGKV